MIFMAATMLAACGESDNRSERTDPGDSDYISTSGQGVQTDEMEIDRTSNLVTEKAEAEEEVPVIDENSSEEDKARAEEIRVQKVMSDEKERISYWTVDENNIKPEAESVRGNLDQLDQNLNRIYADIKNVETGTYNPEGRLSRAAQNTLKEAESKVNAAKEKVRQARQNYEAENHESASKKIKDANESLADARDKYMQAIEKETGVSMKKENEEKVEVM